MEKDTKEFVRTTIDLPAALNEKLIASAMRAKRSRHSQMLFALEKFFETADAGANAEKTAGKPFN